MKKLLCIIMMSIIFSTVVFATDNTSEFIDLSEEHWAYDAIQTLKSMQILSGYENGAFKPNDYVTREEFAVLITKAFNLKQSSSLMPSFSDVTPNKWSYQYIEASKDYLTGYYPYGGTPFFQPEIYTTREDVTVSLVRALNLDLSRFDVLTFEDEEEISRNMRSYIATAVNEHLISGYEDQTFRPQAPITRAEIAVLIHKAIKQSNHGQVFFLEMELPSITNFKNLMIYGKTHPDAKITVNGYVVSNDSGIFSGIYNLNEGEKTYTVNIVSTMPDGRTKSVYKEVEYALPEGYFKVHLDEKTKDQIVYVSGDIYNYDYEHTVRVNQKQINIQQNGHWEERLELQVGENHFDIEMTDHFGDTHKITKSIAFMPSAPIITYNLLPKQVFEKSFSLSGILSDSTGETLKLYINNALVHVSNGGHFNKTYDLKIGVNEFEVFAVNEYGMKTYDTLEVNYEPKATIIKNFYMPETVEVDYCYLEFECENTSGEMFQTYLNGMYLNPIINSRSDQRITHKYQKYLKLKPGINNFVIEVSSGNTMVEKTFEVNYKPMNPSIIILDLEIKDNIEIYSIAVESPSEIFSSLNGESVEYNSRKQLDNNHSIYYYVIESSELLDVFQVRNIYGATSEQEL